MRAVSILTFPDGLHFQYVNIFSFSPHDEVLLRTIGHDLARVRFMSCHLPESGMSMPSLPDLRSQGSSGDHSFGATWRPRWA